MQSWESDGRYEVVVGPGLAVEELKPPIDRMILDASTGRRANNELRAQTPDEIRGYFQLSLRGKTPNTWPRASSPSLGG
ncbi:MAG: hypothetical protein M3Y56_01350 [Armatimonadota bacterium]|nr:hypothetical protein [Armatimonadota bacterium]